MCKDCKKERFNVSLIDDELNQSVDTSFTLDELGETLHGISRLAITSKEETALKVASGVAYIAKQHTQAERNLAFNQSRHEALIHVMQEVLNSNKADALKLKQLKKLIDADSKIEEDPVLEAFLGGEFD